MMGVFGYVFFDLIFSYLFIVTECLGRIACYLLFSECLISHEN